MAIGKFNIEIVGFLGIWDDHDENDIFTLRCFYTVRRSQDFKPEYEVSYNRHCSLLKRNTRTPTNCCLVLKFYDFKRILVMKRFFGIIFCGSIRYSSATKKNHQVFFLILYIYAYKIMHNFIKLILKKIINTGYREKPYNSENRTT